MVVISPGLLFGINCKMLSTEAQQSAKAVAKRSEQRASEARVPWK